MNRVSSLDPSRALQNLEEETAHSLSRLRSEMLEKLFHKKELPDISTSNLLSSQTEHKNQRSDWCGKLNSIF